MVVRLLFPTGSRFGGNISSQILDLLKVASMLSSEAGSGTREGIQGATGCLRSNPIPAGLAACAAFHNCGGFVSEEGGRAAFLRGWGHQRRRAASKATQSLGVDDCNPPFSPLLATSNQQLELSCACSRVHITGACSDI